MSITEPKYDDAPVPKSMLSIWTHRIRCHRYSFFLERRRSSVVYDSRPLLSVVTLMIPFLASSARSLRPGSCAPELLPELQCRESSGCRAPGVTGGTSSGTYALSSSLAFLTIFAAEAGTVGILHLARSSGWT